MEAFGRGKGTVHQLLLETIKQEEQDKQMEQQKQDKTADAVIVASSSTGTGEASHNTSYRFTDDPHADEDDWDHDYRDKRPKPGQQNDEDVDWDDEYLGMQGRTAMSFDFQDADKYYDDFSDEHDSDDEDEGGGGFYKPHNASGLHEEDGDVEEGEEDGDGELASKPPCRKFPVFSKPSSSTTKKPSTNFIIAGMEDSEDSDLEMDYIQQLKTDTKKPETEKAGKTPQIKVSESLRRDGRSVDIPLGSLDQDKHWMAKVQCEYQASCKQKTLVRVKELREVLRECYNSVVNPYVTALYLLEHAPEFALGKPGGVGMEIMKQFYAWTTHNASRGRHASRYVDQHLRVQVFTVLRSAKQGFNYLDLAVKAYEMNHEGNTYFMEHIQPLIREKKCKEAAKAISKLGLQAHYDIRQILMPLILQEKINVVQDYVFRSKSLQQALIAMLDELCGESVDMDSVIWQYQVLNIRRDKVTRKAITKLASRLLKLYQIPQESCPNITRSKALGAVKYLLYKNYIEKTITPDVWDELIVNAVGTDRWLHEQLVFDLYSYNEMQEACKWAKKYAVPHSKLPYGVKQALENSKVGGRITSTLVRGENDAGGGVAGAEEEWALDSVPSRLTSYKPVCHVLSLPAHDVHVITTRREYLSTMDVLNQSGVVVGIDCEWRALIGLVTKTRLSLIQLACLHAVYILDVLALNEVLSDGDWGLFSAMMNDASVTKLGFGIEGDVQMIIDAIPVLSESIYQTQNLVNLQAVKAKVREMYSSVFPYLPRGGSDDRAGAEGKSPCKEKGLSELVMWCVGAPLDKAEQLSDWERRPLRQSQIHYAALDAFCLLEVYDVINMRLQELGIDLDLVTCSQSQGGIQESATATKMKRRQQNVAERPS